MPSLESNLQHPFNKDLVKQKQLKPVTPLCKETTYEESQLLHQTRSLIQWTQDMYSMHILLNHLATNNAKKAHR